MTIMSTRKFDLIKNIVSESSKLRVVASLKEMGYSFVFAPDSSEINNYIAPHRDISQLHRDKDIRYWFSIKALLEHPENTNILLPPYIHEITNILGVIRERIKKPENLVQPIMNLLENEEFRNLLDNFKNENITESDFLLRAVNDYGKELGLLFELMSTHREIDLWNKLERLGNFHTEYNFLKHIGDNTKIHNDSTKWQLAIESYRRNIDASRQELRNNKKVDAITAKSYYDGWAIEYLIRANTIAQQNPSRYPFVIFVSRSSVIHQVAGNSLDFKIKQLGRLLQTFWSPDTYLAYHLIMQAPGREYEQVIQALDDLYIFVKENQNRPQETQNQAVDEILTRSTTIFDEIENASMFYEKLNDEDFFQLMDFKKVLRYQSEEQIKLAGNILDFAKTQQIPELLSKIEENIDTLWLAFKRNLLTYSIDEINNTPSLGIKFPGYRIWIKFKSSVLINWLKESKTIYEILANEDKAIEHFEQQRVSITEINLFQALIQLLKGNLSLFEKILQNLEQSDDPDVIREVALLRYSIKFINGDVYRQQLSNLDKYQNYKQKDPRIEKINGLLSWVKWTKTKDLEYLEDAYKYSRKAYEIANKQSGADFQIECYNNFSYFQALLYETTRGEIITLDDLKSTLNTLQNKCASAYEITGIPIEFEHTIGIFKLYIARNDLGLDDNHRIEMLGDANEKLFSAYRSDRSNTLYKQDWQIARKNFEKMDIKTDK